MKKLIPLVIILLLTACSQENTIHIELAMTYGLQVDNQLQSNDEQLGTITAIKLFDGGKAILVTAKLNAGVEIPINSEFAVVSSDILGTRIIEVTYSNQTETYPSNDTVVGFYIDPLESMIDSIMSNSIDQIMDASMLLDTLDLEGFFDSIFEEQTSIVIPTH